jgi:DNA-binding transcriptional LysR family regulator
MELRHLRYFVAVAEELHFSRAAERLHISPPSLTQQIRALEQELGALLFTRTKRNVTLTDAGTRFLDEARSTLRQAEHAALVARLGGRGEIGRVDIGYASSAACAGLITAAVAEYRRTHPLVSLSLSAMQAARQLEQLSEGRLDIGFLRAPAPYPIGISAVIIGRQPVVLCCQATTSLRRRPRSQPRCWPRSAFLRQLSKRRLAFFSTRPLSVNKVISSRVSSIACRISSQR